MNTLHFRKCTLIAILLYFSTGSLAQSNNLLIKGKILNSDNSLVFEDMSEIGELSVVNASTVIAPESNGDFKFRASLITFFFIKGNWKIIFDSFFVDKLII